MGNEMDDFHSNDNEDSPDKDEQGITGDQVATLFCGALLAAIITGIIVCIGYYVARSFWDSKAGPDWAVKAVAFVIVGIFIFIWKVCCNLIEKAAEK